MVSLDNSVLARIEKGGKRYEALVDPDQIEEWKIDPSKFDLDDVMADVVHFREIPTTVKKLRP